MTRNAGSLAVVLDLNGILMTCAVQVDDEIQFFAEEIEVVESEGALAFEFASEEAAAAQTLPEQCFGGGLGLA